jgi:hypothetical protein
LIYSPGVSAGALALAATLAVRSFRSKHRDSRGQRAPSRLKLSKAVNSQHKSRRSICGGRSTRRSKATCLDLAGTITGSIDARVLSGPDERESRTRGSAQLALPAALRSSSTQARRFNHAAANTEFKGVAIAEMKGENGELTPDSVSSDRW